MNSGRTAKKRKINLNIASNSVTSATIVPSLCIEQESAESDE
jgi:hypothetical protein